MTDLIKEPRVLQAETEPYPNGMSWLGITKATLQRWAETDDDDFVTAGLVLPYMTMRDARILEMRGFKNQYGYPLDDAGILERNKDLSPTDEALKEFWDEERDWLSRVAPDMVYGEAGLLPLDRPRELWVADLKAAQENRDGLAILRLLAQRANLSRGLLAHFRADAFQALGYPELMLTFRRVAAHEFAGRIPYSPLLLSDLMHAERFLEAKHLSEESLRRSNLAPDEIASVASIFMLSSRQIARLWNEGSDTLVKEAEIVQQSLESMVDLPLSPTGSMLAFQTLAAVYHLLGRADQAVEAYSRAIALRPRDGDLYSLRGWVQDDAQAKLADYQQAIILHANYAVPYIVVAEHEIEHGNLNLAKKHAKSAYSKANGNTKLKAIATGLLALAELIQGNRPLLEVVGKFHYAATLDPENEALRANLEAVQEIAKEIPNGLRYKVRISENRILEMILKFNIDHDASYDWEVSADRTTQQTLDRLARTAQKNLRLAA